MQSKCIKDYGDLAWFLQRFLKKSELTPWSTKSSSYLSFAFLGQAQERAVGLRLASEPFAILTKILSQTNFPFEVMLGSGSCKLETGYYQRDFDLTNPSKLQSFYFSMRAKKGISLKWRMALPWRYNRYLQLLSRATSWHKAVLGVSSSEHPSHYNFLAGNPQNHPQSSRKFGQMWISEPEAFVGCRR